MGRVTVAGTVRLDEGARLEASTGSGHRADTDAGPPFGTDSAARPTELVLVALAGCTAIDVVSILRKKRQEATWYEIRVEADSADEPPSVFHRVTVEHVVEGPVDAEALRRCIELSAVRYCPVSRMLSRAVEIEHRYRLRRPGEGELAAVVAVTGPSGDRVEAAAPGGAGHGAQ